jgi:hypothetical protein
LGPRVLWVAVLSYLRNHFSAYSAVTVLSGAEDPSATPTAAGRRRGGWPKAAGPLSQRRRELPETASDRRWQNHDVGRSSSAEAVASSKSVSTKPVDSDILKTGTVLTPPLSLRVGVAQWPQLQMAKPPRLSRWAEGPWVAWEDSEPDQ